METDKLMIGSCVLANINGVKREIVISAISGGGVCEVSGIKEPLNPNAPYDRKWISKNDIEPIPITKEILSRCDLFLAEENMIKGNSSLAGINYEIEDGSIILNCEVNGYVIFIRYLHELQSIYKLITNDEMCLLTE
ncbi:hypothetical protein [Bacteroides thetaiotaomicron]|uniref:hypothetical protein n=1 Tax=Bacteroides thetaiotaomicron TaxID=818 RepID=UPI001898FB72|nr:hypothetical protein [Bacteroides thetaiotaomicron]MDC2169743.1 hypothetical protein [Bacteroides thetaiotaomicron]